ncbi:MAG: hypothetical protein PHW63_00060 [Alphaproteobacteria bacterium]|nr:hypothetical protein [Alphaproteobacteria bacterium]
MPLDPHQATIERIAQNTRHRLQTQRLVLAGQQAPFLRLVPKLGHRRHARRILQEELLHKNGALRIKHNRVLARHGISDIQIAQRRTGDPFSLGQLVLDAAPHIVCELVRVRLGHHRAHVPHHLLHTVGIFVDHVALADKMNFEDVLLHQRV